MSVPRSEYPRPQFARDEWMCLNGIWQFEIDAGDSGLQRGLVRRELEGEILVPFCPESELSGIGHTDFMNAVWYRRTVRVPEAWANRRVLLHLQAVDYDATVWADTGAGPQQLTRHRGGFTPITCDLGDVGGREVTLVVRARDDGRDPKPRGKQSTRYANHGCHYTRTTGIWQTVWLEPVAEAHLERPRITPDVANRRVFVELPMTNTRPGARVRVTLGDADGDVAAVEQPADGDFAPLAVLEIPEDRTRLWSPDDPHLYDLTLELTGAEGTVLDRARSYAGLRSVTIDGMAVKLNGRTLFQRLVLDQGYYPDGIMTAPSDEALRRDIELSRAAGFNGARLHQKVFEERFLYHADRLGYLVWGEFADWSGAWQARTEDYTGSTFITQWLEVLARDYSHPSIVGWCPLNETHAPLEDFIPVHDETMLGMFLAAKAADRTRPVLDTSGWSHRIRRADVWDTHDYSQDPEEFAARQAPLSEGAPHQVSGRSNRSVPYAGQPFFVSEFGGIWWNPEAAETEDSWGYGDRPQSMEAFYERFEGLTGVLLGDPNMFGYCYTQLTDVFQEQNGIYHFDRREKFDTRRIHAAQQRPAAIEAREPHSPQNAV